MSVFELWVFFVALPAINGFGVVGIAIMSVLAIILLVVLLVTEFDSEINRNIIDGLKRHRSIFYILISLMVIGNFMPNEKQIELIVGGSVVTNVEGIEQLPENIVNAANTYLKAIEKKD